MGGGGVPENDPEISPPGNAVDETLKVPPLSSKLSASAAPIEKRPLSEPDVVVPNGTVSGNPDRLAAIASPSNPLKPSETERLNRSSEIVALPNPDPGDPVELPSREAENTMLASEGRAVRATAARNPAIEIRIDPFLSDEREQNYTSTM
jgi:hypothetical protein